MFHLLTTGLTFPALGVAAGLGVALTLLVLLVGLSIYAGLYYTVPRMVLKWLTRQAIPVV